MSRLLNRALYALVGAEEHPAMLARSGQIPTRGDSANEVKWEGSVALVSSESGLRVRSRLGWNMTDLVPELAALLSSATLGRRAVRFRPGRCPGLPAYLRADAKRQRGRYPCGQRGWVKIKNREYWRYELECELRINERRVKQFV